MRKSAPEQIGIMETNLAMMEAIGLIGAGQAQRVWDEIKGQKTAYTIADCIDQFKTAFRMRHTVSLRL